MPTRPAAKDLNDVKLFHDACREIIELQKTYPHNLKLNYAAAYALSGLEMDDPEYIESQIIYILSNLSGISHASVMNNVRATLTALKERING